MTCESGYVLFDFIYLLVYSFIHSNLVILDLGTIVCVCVCLLVFCECWIF